jgi:hypothetical protein
MWPAAVAVDMAAERGVAMVVRVAVIVVLIVAVGIAV